MNLKLLDYKVKILKKNQKCLRGEKTDEVTLIFESIINHSSNFKQTRKSRVERLQSGFTLMMFVSFAVAILGAGLTHIWDHQWLVDFSWLMVLVSQSCAVFSQIGFIVEILTFMRNPFKTYMGSHLERLSDQNELAKKLTAYGAQSLRYAASCFEIEARQLTERVGVIIGPISKLGLIPIFVSWLYMVYRIGEDPNWSSNVDWLVYTVTGLYIVLSFPMNKIVQKCERYNLVLQTALDLKNMKGKRQALRKQLADNLKY